MRPLVPRAFPLALFVLVVLSACVSPWATSAAAANELTGAAREEVLEAREDALTRAGQAVLEAGGDTEAIELAVRERARDFDDDVAAVNLAIAVKDRYVQLALDALRGTLPAGGRAAAGRTLRDFGAVYRAEVMPLLERLGRPAPPFPAELEAWIADLLEGEPDEPAPPDESTSGGEASFVHLHTAGVS